MEVSEKRVVSVSKDEIVAAVSDRIHLCLPGLLRQKQNETATVVWKTTCQFLHEISGPDAKCLIIGSKGNNLNLREGNDIDIQILPSMEQPDEVAANVYREIAKLDKVEIMAGEEHEADREYKAAYLDKESGLIILYDAEIAKGKLGTIRVVKPRSVSVNLLNCDPIIEIGFAIFEDGKWYSALDYDPSQNQAIIIDGDGSGNIVEADKNERKNSKELPPVSRLVMALRQYSKDRTICLEGTMSPVVDNVSEYVFKYNILPSLLKVEHNIGHKALLDPNFRERILKYACPGLYKVLGVTFSGKTEADAEELMKSYSRTNYGSFVRLAIVSTNEYIVQSNKSDPGLREHALKLTSNFGTLIYDLNFSRAAQMMIKD